MLGPYKAKYEKPIVLGKKFTLTFIIIAAEIDVGL